MQSQPSISGSKIGGRKAYSISEFCEIHGISRSFYYELRRRGLAPKEMEVLSRKLISEEAAAEWRAEREVA
jgi:hypothetical protein